MIDPTIRDQIAQLAQSHARRHIVPLYQHGEEGTLYERGAIKDYRASLVAFADDVLALLDQAAVSAPPNGPQAPEIERIQREYWSKGYRRGQTEKCQSCHQCGGALDKDSPDAGLRCSECDECDAESERALAAAETRVKVLEQQLQAVSAPGVWRPIETAPKGGADIIVRGRRCHVLSPKGTVEWGTFTHWMPLPNPPSASGGDPLKEKP